MRKIYKTTVILAVIMFAAKLVAFGRDIVLTNCYGASYISDAFLVSASIPNVLFNGMVTALFTCYIPCYQELRAKRAEEIEAFHGNLIMIVLCTSCLLTVLYWLFDDAILRVLAAGFDDAAFQLAKEMSRIMSVVMVFMGVTYILQGFLQANGSFYLAGAMTIPVNLITALSIWASTEHSLQSMAWGMVAGYVFYLPYFGIPAYKKGFRFRLHMDFLDDNIKKMVRMIMPIFIGQIIFEVNAIVDKSVASLLPAGGVTALDYSFKLMSVIHSSVAAPIAATVYARFSEYAAEERTDELKKTLHGVLRVMEIIVIPIVGGSVILAEPIIKVLFFRGAFTAEAVQITTASFIAYACSAVPISLRIICEKIFYARKETKMPMLNSMIGIAVNMILDLVLVQLWAHIGIALATTVSSFVTCFLFLASLYRRVGPFGARQILCTGTRSVAATVVMCISIMFLEPYLAGSGDIVRICLCLIVGAVIYTAVLLLLKEELLLDHLKARRKI